MDFNSKRDRRNNTNALKARNDENRYYVLFSLHIAYESDIWEFLREWNMEKS